MMKWMAWCFLSLAFLPFVNADVLVLKNGKRIVLPGSYEVRGQYVVFENQNGEINQLPLKLVDLEQSKQATTEHLAMLEAQQKKLAEEAAASKEIKRSVSMAEVAEYIESQRGVDEPLPTINAKSKKIEKFGESNPRPTNDGVEVESSSSGYFENLEGQRNNFNASFQSIKKEIEDLTARIDQQEAFVTHLGQESAFGDDPTGSTYEALETAEKQLEDLRANRTKKEKELQELDRQARQAGVGNYKRGSAGAKEEQ